MYFNPARWSVMDGRPGTLDGKIPWQLFLGYAKALYPIWAMERIKLALSVGLSLAGKEEGPRLWRQAKEEAYPLNGQGSHG